MEQSKDLVINEQKEHIEYLEKAINMLINSIHQMKEDCDCLIPETDIACEYANKVINERFARGAIA